MEHTGFAFVSSDRKLFLNHFSLCSLCVCVCVPANYKSPEWVAWEFLIIVIMLLLYWNWNRNPFARAAHGSRLLCGLMCGWIARLEDISHHGREKFTPRRAAFYDYFLFIFVEILNPHAFRFPTHSQLSLSEPVPTACLPGWLPFAYPLPACLVYYYPFAGTFLWVKPDAAYLCDNAVGTRNWKCPQFPSPRLNCLYCQPAAGVPEQAPPFHS